MASSIKCLIRNAPDTQVKAELLVNGVVVPGQVRVHKHRGTDGAIFVLSGSCRKELTAGDRITIQITPEYIGSDEEGEPKTYKAIGGACSMVVSRIRQFE